VLIKNVYLSLNIDSGNSTDASLFYVEAVGKTFLLITTAETKTAVLLIDIFKKLLNQQNYGHLDHLQVAVSYLSGFLGP